jgi:hypothetical protein
VEGASLPGQRAGFDANERYRGSPPGERPDEMRWFTLCLTFPYQQAVRFDDTDRSCPEHSQRIR